MTKGCTSAVLKESQRAIGKVYREELKKGTPDDIARQKALGQGSANSIAGIMAPEGLGFADSVISGIIDSISGNGSTGASGGSGGTPPPANTKEYNSAESKSVGVVNQVEVRQDAHNVPMKGLPNSVTQNFIGDKLVSERYYDKDGKAYLDIHYTDHGNPKKHPNVPHEHSIHYKNNKPIWNDPPEGGISK